ncbi:hypothetical protein GUITHDRAFT_107709 [Guillardia theta CCMP2712]|uniref:Uncharacterized protein n=1 Tax=Guillardia theta (strain CCMP2712) TaxID=905079 RepID=L1JD90_GUITC|nr:hypothetical protein GUITHDRAFT_107709 [Guillardia theta CCMP2712]EKX46503.1 hypothetical protein GUITHDRAFT_107709 [Guillardia theta CCMP2712]|eukprot:XP_005833483.1 hypothetical protein GUITHDRAFT_107709 [Guillardia theta CCMP2712]
MRRILHCHEAPSEEEAGAAGDLLCGVGGLDEKERREVVWKDLKEALGRRSHVYQLDLSRQGLKKLPAEIGRLNKVEVCDLSQNDLDHDGLPEDPRAQASSFKQIFPDCQVLY